MMLSAGCLGTLRADPAVEAIARVPEAELSLAPREDHRHWFLRGESGWCGAHELRYGGDPSDPAVDTVRAVLFKSDNQAQRAFDRLTPKYLLSLLRGRMNDVPRPTEYPEPIPGDAARVMEYDVRLTVANSPDITLYGQLTAVRAGRVVILMESIGVPPEQLVPAIREMVRAAYRLPADGKC